MTKPPLETHYELVAADDTRYRWAGDSTDAGRVPVGGTWASKRYEGFERSSVRLQRPVDRDYPDLGLFDGFNVIGYDGSVAYEGMLGQVGRSTPLDIEVQGTGWMASARHRTMRENYVTRDLGWRGPGNQRSFDVMVTAGLAFASGSITPQTDAEGRPGLNAQIDRLSTPPEERLEAWWTAGELPIGTVYLGFDAMQGIGVADANWDSALYSVDADPGSVFTSLFDSDGADVAAAYYTVAGHPYLLALFGFHGTATQDGPWAGQFHSFAAYGTHGLARRGLEHPQGFYVSDIIRDVAARWCPELNTAGVLDTTWPVREASWPQRIHPYDVWLELNKYHLFELGVWERRTLHYAPADLTDYDWQVRASDPGVQVKLEGDSIDHLANYAIVEFTNSLTGLPTEITPAEYPELLDGATENPANRHGLQVELLVTLSDAVDPDSAAQIGRMKLAENNQPTAAGTITFQGHIRDRAGHWQQGWKVRATDTIAIVDWPNNRTRLITEVEWNQDTKTGTVAVDGQVLRVDAILDRVSTSLRVAGL